jgi:hypothetical protein
MNEMSRNEEINLAHFSKKKRWYTPDYQRFLIEIGGRQRRYQRYKNPSGRFFWPEIKNQNLCESELSFVLEQN